MQDDFDLLDRWAAGDNTAARELVQRHTGALVRFFERKLQGPVEDHVQDTLLACVESRDRFRRESGFRGYLFGIARNVLFAQLRARNREHGELDLESSCLHDLGPSPSEIIARKKEERLLLEALRHLPVDTQVLLELYFWQRVTGPEIATMYGIGEKALRSRLLRAKKALQAIVGKLAESPSLLHSTWADFEGWAKELPSLDDGDELDA
jgi:RNA polymerase sigma factor (sigma-70 family)